MSVGHYIAYTSSLSLCTEYLNCQKENLKHQNHAAAGINGGQQSNASMPPPASGEKNSGLIKKMYFKNKTSSAGDVTKNIKNNLNGVMSKFVNGSDKLLATVSGGFGGDKSSSSLAGERNVTGGGGVSSNQQATMCPGLNCCGIRAESVLLRNSNGMSLAETPFDGVNINQSGLPTNTTTSASCRHVEPVWYMCDDDKIRAMSQGEFIDLLSPNHKVTITPYLLFYARD